MDLDEHIDESRIDPDGKYLEDRPRVFELVAAHLLDHRLPLASLERTRDCIQLTEPDDPGVVVVLTPVALEIHLPTLEWEDPHTPRNSIALYRRIPLGELDPDELPDLLNQARDARLAQFSPCHFCRKSTPPEHAHEMEGVYACHACCEREFGIVH